ncbi:MAG: M23 family metallopeptidase [Ignavibacteria bacterium]|nr:M23 family metallopeptidase [Ignavibacteria bacterium]
MTLIQIGDTIVASRPGTVVFVNEQYSDSDWVNGHENNVFIQHSDGTRMRYTHLKQFGVIVEAGKIVQAGQPLALSGSSEIQAVIRIFIYRHSGTVPVITVLILYL